MTREIKTEASEKRYEYEYVNCNVCGEDKTELMFATKDLQFDYPGAFFLVKCKNCGLVYLNPRPTKHTIGNYYPADYVIFQPSPNSTNLLKKILRRLWLTYNKCFIRDYTDLWLFKDLTRGKALDIGCGNGGYLKRLKEEGWSVFGVDISAIAVESAKNLGFSVFRGELADMKFKSDFFKVITLKHVLEHVHDPLGLLREAHRILSDDGILMICVPNIKNWEVQLFRQYWFPIETPRHLYQFDFHTLNLVLKRAGFEINTLKYEYSAEPFAKSISYLTGRKLEKLLVNHVSYGCILPVLGMIYYIHGDGQIIVVRANKIKGG